MMGPRPNDVLIVDEALVEPAKCYILMVFRRDFKEAQTETEPSPGAGKETIS